MLTFEEFKKKTESDLLDFWGQLRAGPISAEEFIDLTAKKIYKQYLEGFCDALVIVSDKIDGLCSSRMYSDGDDAFDAIANKVIKLHRKAKKQTEENNGTENA